MGADKKSGISFPNYKDIAKAHKIKYIQILNNDEAKRKISHILSSRTSYICELMIDPEQAQKPKAINRRLPSGKSIPTTYEDMHPFLKKEEILNSSFEKYLIK